MRIYRPRVFAALTVPVLGTRQERINQAASSSTIELPLRPHRVRLESNDHNEADRLSITCDWRQTGLDPRLLDDATIQLHIANADESDRWEPSRANCRFVGVMKEITASRRLEAPGVVDIECVDYTDFFLRAKPFGSSGIPRYEQTLREAWRTIVSQTPGAAVLGERLVFEGGTQGLVIEGLEDPVESLALGVAVAERFRKLGQVPTKPETDAWAVWQQCVGMLGLISYIRGDECVVTTATNYYTEGDAPRFIWGQNIEEWTETRVCQVVDTGIGLTSFDPLTGRALEALWPPVGDTRVQKKRTSARKIQSEEQARLGEKREYYSLPGVTNLDVLTAIARRIFEERSRQELEGRVVTREMEIERESGAAFDLLALRAGDTVAVQVEPEHQQLLGSLPNDSAQVRMLTDRGYTEPVAELIVKNVAHFAELGAKFHVKQVATEVEYDSEGGRFSLEVSYVNRINVTGDTDGGAS